MTGDSSSPRIVTYDGEQARALGPRVYGLYTESFRGPPHREQESRSQYLARWERHVERPRFVLLALESTGNHRRTVGFLYGYRSDPGTWWHDRVAANLPTRARGRWLADAFELVELGVIPRARGRGFGVSLVRRVLELATTRTVVLSTHRDRNPVVRLYLREGFEVIHPGMSFSEGGDPFVVMARQTPAGQRQGPDPARH
jgi:ribosomal protein S18 acetylase RimI-like enzyme